MSKHIYGYQDGFKCAFEKRSNTEELKPCPFCGGEAEVFSQYNSIHECIVGYVRCTNCRITLQSNLTVNMLPVVEDISRIATNAHREVKKDAAKKWNKRIYE